MFLCWLEEYCIAFKSSASTLSFDYTNYIPLTPNTPTIYIRHTGLTTSKGLATACYKGLQRGSGSFKVQANLCLEVTIGVPGPKETGSKTIERKANILAFFRKITEVTLSSLYIKQRSSKTKHISSIKQSCLIGITHLSRSTEERARE